jgi:hypothetical protein
MEFDDNNTNLLDEPRADKIQDNPRLDSLNAFFVLFSVSFGPAFISIDLSTDATTSTMVTGLTLVVIIMVFLMNFVSVWMLTSVHTYTKLGSY